MSKNTGTSELINYFDLGVNGDVGIAGSLDINTIANATTDTDTFLVSDTGIIKYRTGAQLLSDIGAAPAVAGGYVPYTGATTNVDLGVYNLTASAIIANGSGSNSGIVHLESNAIHSLVNGYGSIASGTTNQFNLYQTTGAGVFRGAILSLNSITEFATRTFTLPDADGTIALTSNIPANAVGGTGTTNYLPKFTGSTTIGNSQIIDNGSQVGIGLTPNASYGTLQIKSPSSVYSIDLVGRTAGLNSENQITFWNSTQTTGLAYIYNSLSNLYLGTGANQPFTLSSGGNFIFGTTTDNGAKLQVSGAATVSSSLTANGNIFLANDGTYGSSYITLGFGGTSNGSNRIFAGTSSSVDGIFIASATGRPISFRAGGGTTDHLIIASTGAATFSSSVTAQVNNISADGAGVVLQGYVDNTLRIAVRGSGYNDGARGGLLASTGDFGSSVTADSLLVQRAASRNMLGISTLSLPTSGDEEGVAVIKTNSALWQLSTVGYAADSKGVRFYNNGGVGYTAFEVAQAGGPRFIVNGIGNVLIGTQTDSGTRLNVNGTTFTQVFTQSVPLHGVKVLSYGPTSSATIDLPTEFPLMLLTAGNVWGVFGKYCGFDAGGVEVREFVIARNSGGGWAAANYGPQSQTNASLQSVTGSGNTITINVDAGCYFIVELTVFVR